MLEKNKSDNSVPHMPHDAVFKQFLTNPRTAKDFMQLHLPSWVQPFCNFDTLKLECGSFVEESMRPYYSDVLYSLKTTSGAGYIYVLIEHQSTPDRYMAFRLFRYAVAAMQRHLEAGHKHLPLVIPVLYYMGKRSPYPYSTQWLDLFADPKLAGKVYSNDFPLVDVTVIPDDEILDHRSMAALTLMQKHIRQREISNILDKISSLFLSGEDITRQQMETLVNYLLRTGETEDASAFIEQIAQSAPQIKDEMMTIAQQLKQLGIKQGIEQGITQGIEQGIQKGIQQGMQLGEQQGIEIGYREKALKIARTMLEKGFDRASVMEMTGLSEDEFARACH